MDSLVTNVTVNGKYKMTIERAASANKVVGYKVEANGDVLADVVIDAHNLQKHAEEIANLAGVSQNV